MSGRVAKRQLEALLEPLQHQRYEAGPQQPAAKKTPVVSQVLSKKALKKQQKQRLKQEQQLSRKAGAARTALERNLAFIQQTQRAEAARASLMQQVGCLFLDGSFNVWRLQCVARFRAPVAYVCPSAHGGGWVGASDTAVLGAAVSLAGLIPLTTRTTPPV